MYRAMLPALGSALLFGATHHLQDCSSVRAPVLLAGLLVRSERSGIAGVARLRSFLARGRTSSRLTARDLPVLTGAIFLGGVAGPFC